MIEVRKRLKLDVGDNMMWDTAIRVLNASKIGDNPQNNTKPKKDFVATEKQRAFLKKMKIEFTDDDKQMSSDVNRLLEEKKAKPKEESKQKQPEPEDTGKDLNNKGEYF